jgi:hypothetical protein
MNREAGNGGKGFKDSSGVWVMSKGQVSEAR